MIEPRLAEPGSAIHLQLSPALAVDDASFADLCRQNPDLRIERTSEGAVIIMAPAGGDAGRRNQAIGATLYMWARADGTGTSYDSSAGFTLHNITEGLAVATPLTKAAPRPVHFIALTLLAGAPAMLGTLVGAYAYSDLGATLFMAVGAGAIAQVVYAVSKYLLGLMKKDELPGLNPITVGGFAAGVAIMYVTALVVAA